MEKLVVPCKRCGEFGHEEAFHDQPLRGPDGEVKYANVVVLKKAHQNARNWEPVKPEDVPEWLKAPEVMGQLVKGQCAHKESAGKEWYVARPAAEAAKILHAQLLAQEKRERKAQKRAGEVRRTRVQAAHAVKH